MSLIDELGSLYLASRLVRLSDTLKKDAALIFNEQLHGIKYKWYPVLYAVHCKPGISVVELANELSYAHPTIIEALAEMQQQKLIQSIADKKDKRRRILSLTAKGKGMIIRMQPVLTAFEKAVTDLMESKHQLLKAIESVEAKLKEENFFNRVNKAIIQPE